MSQLLTDVDHVSELSTVVSDRWATVVSIVPFEINTKKPGLIPGYFRIPASKNGIPSLCHVPICIHFIYLDEDRGHLPQENNPDKVAKAIVFDYINAQIATGPGAIPGITFLDGKLTLKDVLGDKYKEELDRIKVLQKGWFKRVAQMAKDDWTRYKQHAAISDIQRIVAIEEGLDPKENPWMDQTTDIVKNVECPACMEFIKRGAKICKHCRTDLVAWAERNDPEEKPTVENEIKKKEEETK